MYYQSGRKNCVRRDRHGPIFSTTCGKTNDRLSKDARFLRDGLHNFTTYYVSPTHRKHFDAAAIAKVDVDTTCDALVINAKSSIGLLNFENSEVYWAYRTP